MTTRAEHLIELALFEVRSRLDALPTLSAAEAQLRIEAGELPASEMQGYACDCPDETTCPFEEG